MLIMNIYPNIGENLEAISGIFFPIPISEVTDVPLLRDRLEKNNFLLTVISAGMLVVSSTDIRNIDIDIKEIVLEFSTKSS